MTRFLLIGLAGLLTAAFCLHCDGSKEPVAPKAIREGATEPPASTATKQAAIFSDVTVDLGIDFLHQDGRSGERYYIETAASGGGWFDFDDDGDLDLYLINGAQTPGSKLTTPPQNRLYENRSGRFIDVTDQTGLGDTGYGMGFCLGDYDGDGYTDLFITNYGPDRLYRNKGDGTFEDVAAAAGVAGDRWGTGCTFGDIDGDGDLDLYVSNYVDFSFEKNHLCGNGTSQIKSYCRPKVFPGQVDYLYINQGNGVFREEGAKRGIDQGTDTRSFSAVFSDMDNDGDLDLHVASDGSMNRFYVNDGKGYFTDESLLSGIGFNEDGHAEAGMGMDFGDVNGDGLADVIVTNYAAETNTLYMNRGDLLFEDGTRTAGLAGISYKPVSWGVKLLDYDNDGDLDMAVANGHVMDNINLIAPDETYAQANHLLENDGKGNFSDISAKAGRAFTELKVSRGLASGDWDNDGRLDLLITNNSAQPDLAHNTHRNNNHWIGFKLIGPKHNRLAFGAMVTLSTDNGKIGVREVISGGSFLAQSDTRAHFGLGAYQGPLKVEIRWPDGKRTERQITQTDQYINITYE